MHQNSKSFVIVLYVVLYGDRIFLEYDQLKHLQVGKAQKMRYLVRFGATTIQETLCFGLICNGKVCLNLFTHILGTPPPPTVGQFGPLG